MMGLAEIFGRHGRAHPELLSLPLDEACYVVIDTELTGLDRRKDSIVSLGAIKMTGGRIDVGNTFYRLVKPESDLSSESVVVHGITPSEVAELPSIDSVMDEFLAFCKGCVVTGHFVSLDLVFLNKELKRLSREAFDNPIVDTYRICDWMEHQEGNFSRHFGENGEKDLFSLADRYGIQVTGAHNALMDAFVTAQLFQRFLSLLPKLGVKTVKDLVKIGRP
jgi:DNA polymerase-3 subunit epsilon